MTIATVTGAKAPRMTMLQNTPGRPRGNDPALHPGLNPDVRRERIQQGRTAEHEAGTLPGDVRSAPAYFRTYDQVKARMFALQEKYPDLVTVKDIGDSYDKKQGTADRDVLVMTLTNRNSRGAKPVVEHVAGVHAREIANPELLVQWAEQVLEGYGRDPEATALLDTREIDLIPIANPDGHAVVERGFTANNRTDLMKRKNNSPPNGTDLNRNFDFHWGGPGASASPHSETYRGPSAASEHETKAVQEYTAQRKPNLFMDWHSYSKLVLYPWGDTREKAPDYVGLKAVAEKFATYNHYSPIQAVDLYPTTGTTDDWAYGKLGIPAWAVETGSSFHQTDREFAKTFAENAPVLWYSGRIADDPYVRGQGPDTLDLLVDRDAGQLRARVTDITNGKDAIRGAELLVDPFAKPGSGTPLVPADGAFDSMSEDVMGTLPTSLRKGRADGRLVYVRAQDARGHWGPATPQWLDLPARDLHPPA